MTHSPVHLASSAARRSLSKHAAGFAALAVGMLAYAAPAAADNRTVLGVDLSFNDTVAGDETDSGVGVDVYFGPRLDLAILTLTTEIAGGVHWFGGPLDATVYRGMAGGRLGIGVILRPSVFAHIGVGHLRFDEPFGERDGRTNLAADVGAALDLTVLPLIDVGIQGSYNVIAGNDVYEPFEWLQAGAHITFVFDDR